MNYTVKIRGHVSVVLVMNMRRFIEPGDVERFEGLRGTREFLDVLREQWPRRIQSKGAFSQSLYDHEDEAEARMSVDEVGFMTGVFRLNALENHMPPTYFLAHKNAVAFPPEVLNNLQFKNIFDRVWRRWDIYVRPTAAGLFVVRLKRTYSRATPVLNVASDIVDLQTAFDVRSALRYLETHFEADPRKRESIDALLNWLGVGTFSLRQMEMETWRPQFAPVQWKMALEVCGKLVMDAGLSISAPGVEIRLREPDRTISTPLHDSYIIYHFDEVLAPNSVVARARQIRHQKNVLGQSDASDEQNAFAETSVDASDSMRSVKPWDIQYSAELQHYLLGLVEGALLSRRSSETRAEKGGVSRIGGPRARRSDVYFPRHETTYLSRTLETNIATWENELCLLTPRAAVIMPLHEAANHDLYVSNFSVPTSRVMYGWYWATIERMLEFVVETRVLAQLMERRSAKLLREFEKDITGLRADMLTEKYVGRYERFASHINNVANVSRMLSIGQSLGTPSAWSRAEFAIQKARQLLDHQSVPRLLQHTERNVSNLNELINHMDELYLAQLSERTNRKFSYISLGLALFSLSFGVLTIASFWADIEQLRAGAIGDFERFWLPILLRIGDLLILVLLAAFVVLLASWRRLFRRAARKGKRRLRGLIGRH